MDKKTLFEISERSKRTLNICLAMERVLGYQFQFFDMAEDYGGFCFTIIPPSTSKVPHLASTSYGWTKAARWRKFTKALRRHLSKEGVTPAELKIRAMLSGLWFDGPSRK